MAGSIAVSEPDSLRRELIDVRGVVKRAPIASDVRPTKVINEEEDNIRRLRLSDTAKKSGGESEEYSIHGFEGFDLGFGSTVQPGVLIMP